MNEKIYKIADKNFILNTDLDLNEAEEVQKFFSKTTGVNNTVNFGAFNKEEIIKLYSIILKTADGNKLPEEFSFSKIKESVQIEVIKDFFLSRIEKISSLKNSLSS